MSVINQALRQLDQRTQRQSEGVDILITLPRRPSRIGRLTMVIGVVAILFAVGGYWFGLQLPALLEPFFPTGLPTPPALLPVPPHTDLTSDSISTATSVPKAASQTEPPYLAPASGATATAYGTSPPFISRLSPNPTPSSLIRQLYILTGSGLQTVTAAEICLPNGRCQQIPAARFVQQGELEIQLYLIPGNGPEQWSIQLLAPNGSSNRYQLDILAPPPLLSPATLPAATAPEPPPPRPVAVTSVPSTSTAGVPTTSLKAAPIPPPSPAPAPASPKVGGGGNLPNRAAPSALANRYSSSTSRGSSSSRVVTIWRRSSRGSAS